MNELAGKNIVVFDLEIKKPINECAKGWSGYDEMGISVGCAFDYRNMRYRVFLDDNMRELVDRLNEDGTLIVAFNHMNFDNKLLRANAEAIQSTLKEDKDLLNYDMLRISRSSAEVTPFTPGFKLDDHLLACGLPMKTANGAMAPLWWQQSKIGTVVDYCLNDVAQEKALFEYIIANGKLSSLNYKDYEVRKPHGL